ncbi:hypothetical protein ACFWA5_51195 [Streptomyces mirabilis]|uniref:hypothetical protein n=1 Tax=Streptomyces mirabilis TaxID=68239 RepID=UPI003663BDDB
MNAPPLQPRHTLLPDREHSRAVLVASDVSVRQPLFYRHPEDLTAQLAEVLTAPGPDGALHPESTALVSAPEHPGDVIDALRQAAEAASDVLLFYYAGSTFSHEGKLFFRVMGTDPQRPDTGVGLDAIAEIMNTGRAARPVVILDSDDACLVASRFAETVSDLSLIAGSQSSFWPMSDPFTETLLTGLTSGVQDGPQALDLVTLRHAIEADYTRTTYLVENEYVGPPGHVVVRGGRELALGVNPAFGQIRRGALPSHPDVVHEQECPSPRSVESVIAGEVGVHGVQATDVHA